MAVALVAQQVVPLEAATMDSVAAMEAQQVVPLEAATLEVVEWVVVLVMVAESEAAMADSKAAT